MVLFPPEVGILTLQFREKISAPAGLLSSEGEYNIYIYISFRIRALPSGGDGTYQSLWNTNDACYVKEICYTGTKFCSRARE